MRTQKTMILNAGKPWQMVSVYSGAHFLVDFACAFLMFRSITGTPEGYLCVLLYNFFAFAMQMPLGVIADKLNRNFQFAMIGCLLIGLGYVFSFPVAAVIVIGTGNAMFHIGGGIDVLNISEKKLGALGLFVSPGAFGVYSGTILGKGIGFSALPAVPILLVAAAGLIFMAHGKRDDKAVETPPLVSGRILIAIACLFLVVCLRSYVGLSLNFSWKAAGYWGLALICAVVLGKTIGGFAADRFGVTKIAFFSLGIAAVLFLFPAIPPAGVAAVLLFNMTMPVTLWALAKTLPGAKGFAFGLLAFGLFIGFLPVYLGADASSAASWLFAALAAVSLFLLRTGLRKAGL